MDKMIFISVLQPLSVVKGFVKSSKSLAIPDLGRSRSPLSGGSAPPRNVEKIGPMTHPRRPRQVVTPRRPPLLPKVVTAVGLVVLATTFLSAVPALIGPISFLLTWFIPVPVLDWFTAVALLILGSALQRRMRVGWVATTFLTL